VTSRKPDKQAAKERPETTGAPVEPEVTEEEAAAPEAAADARSNGAEAAAAEEQPAE